MLPQVSAISASHRHANGQALYQDEMRAPLHLAAVGGHGKIVEALVEAKADLCAQDKVSVSKETRLDADRGMR